MLALLGGFVLGLSLAAPPGPVLALMADTTLRRGAWDGVKVGLGAMTADAGFFLIAWAGAVTVLAAHPGALAAATLAGAGVLAFYAYGAWRSAGAAGDVREVRPATYVTGLVAAATSPFSFAWWVGPGSALIASAGLLIVLGLFLGLLSWTLFFPNALRWFGQRVHGLHKVVAWASAFVLAAFAVWMGVRGVAALSASF